MAQHRHVIAQVLAISWAMARPQCVLMLSFHMPTLSVVTYPLHICNWAANLIPPRPPLACFTCRRAST